MNSHADVDAPTWSPAPLSRFLTLAVKPVSVEPDRIYPIVGVLNRGRGLLYREPIAGDATAYGTLNKIEPSVLIYSRLKAFEGALTVTPSDLPESYASQEFPTFSLTLDADPQFFRILATSKPMWDALQSASKGMGGRRERVKPSDFLRLTLPVPPLGIQQQIAELIGTIDYQIAALGVEAEALLNVRRGLIWRSPDTAQVSIGDLASVTQGRGLPKNLQGLRSGELPWYKIADMTSPGNEFGYQVADTRLTVPEIAEAGGVIAEVGSVTFPRVGAAVLTEKKRILDVAGALDENHLVLTPAGETNSEYLLTAMENFAMSSLVRPGAVPSLNMSLIRSTRVPWSWTENGSLAAALGDLRTGTRVLAAEVARLRAVRVGLLSGLLNRTVDIEPTGSES